MSVRQSVDARGFISGRLLSWREQHWLGILVVTTAIALGLLLAHQLNQHRFEVRRWDYMLVSGCVAAIVGLWLARGQPQRFDLAVI